MPGPLVVQIAQASRRIPLAMPMLNKFARDNPSAVIMSASYPYGGIGALAQSVAGGSG